MLILQILESTFQKKEPSSSHSVLCCTWLFSRVWLFETPWTAAHQAPLSMGILQATILEWVAMPSSRESSQPRDQTQVSHTAGIFFTVWATREAHENWSGWPIPSPGDLPDPGLELGSPTMQADSLPAELPGSPLLTLHRAKRLKSPHSCLHFLVSHSCFNPFPVT